MPLYLRICRIALTLCALPLSVVAAKFDTSQLEKSTGWTGAWNEAGTAFRLESPRKDIKVAVDHWRMPPSMGLVSWVALKENKPGELALAAELVLLQDEVMPVMRVGLQSNLCVTALHDHFLYDDPRVCFLRITGTGTTEQLAKTLEKIIRAQKETRRMRLQVARGFRGVIAPENTITPAVVEKILGIKGRSENGTLRFVFPAGPESKQSSNGEMGPKTWFAFGGSDALAVWEGDFALSDTGLKAILKELCDRNVNVTAIYSCSDRDTPPMFLVHFWGKGRADFLAKVAKSILGQL